jgi:glycerol transport system permease protein
MLQASEFGPMAAFSITYFLIILLFSWLFYTVIINVGKGT